MQSLSPSPGQLTQSLHLPQMSVALMGTLPDLRRAWLTRFLSSSKRSFAACDIIQGTLWDLCKCKTQNQVLWITLSFTYAFPSKHSPGHGEKQTDRKQAEPLG